MYDKALNVWSLGKLVSFVLPVILMFPTNIGTIGKTKTNCFPREHTLTVCIKCILLDDKGINRCHSFKKSQMFKFRFSCRLIQFPFKITVL